MKIKWYYKIGLIFVAMFFLSYLFIGSEFGIQGNLLTALIMTAMFSPIFFIDFTSKASTERGKEKMEKYTLKQRILIDILAIVIFIAFLCILFWFTS